MVLGPVDNGRAKQAQVSLLPLAFSQETGVY